MRDSTGKKYGGTVRKPEYQTNPNPRKRLGEWKKRTFEGHKAERRKISRRKAGCHGHLAHVTLAGNARHIYGDFQGKPALSELVAGISIGVGDRGVRRQVMVLSNGICLESQWFG